MPHDHRTVVLDSLVGAFRTLDEEEVDNLDHALEDREAGRGHHRWPAGLDADILVVLHAVVAFHLLGAGGDRQCALARKPAPAMTPV